MEKKKRQKLPGKVSGRQNLPSGRVTDANFHSDMEKYLEGHADELKVVDDPKEREDLVKAAKTYVWLRGMAEVASDRAQATLEQAECDYRISVRYKFKDEEMWSEIVTVPMPKRPG